MSASELLEYNPWWKDENAIKSDPEIQSWSNSKLKWNPRLRQTFKAEDYVYSLRGPSKYSFANLLKLGRINFRMTEYDSIYKTLKIR